MLKVFYSYSFASVTSAAPYLSKATSIDVYFNDGEVIELEYVKNIPPEEDAVKITNGSPEKFHGEVTLSLDRAKQLEEVYGLYVESAEEISGLQNSKHFYIDYLETLEFLGDCVVIEESVCALSASEKTFMLLPSVLKYNFDLSPFVYETYEVDLLGTRLGMRISQEIINAFNTMKSFEYDVVKKTLITLGMEDVAKNIPENVRTLTYSNSETKFVLEALEKIEGSSSLEDRRVLQSLKKWRNAVQSPFTLEDYVTLMNEYNAGLH